MSTARPDGGVCPASLERGEVSHFPHAPFPLPAAADRAFLLRQRGGGFGRKHICYDPHARTLTGQGGGDADRLAGILADFSRGLQAWLAEALPAYVGGIDPDRATFRPEEEATRSLRPHARNDLLHVDAFPSRPARGRRILRVFANLHPTEPRVWATAEPLARLLPRYRGRLAKSNAGWFHSWGARVLGLFRPDHASPEDVFMLRLHDYLKCDLDFQQRGTRRLWRFGPGAGWLAMTDGCTYAELRGQFALEHSFFIAPEVLACPELAPARLIAA